MLSPAIPGPAESHVTSAGRWAGEVSRAAGRRKFCSGDRYDLAGNAHWWSEFGEDDEGTLYRCDICGVTDVG